MNKTLATLIAGASVLALSSGAGFAQATVQIGGVTAGTPLTTDASGNLSDGTNTATSITATDGTSSSAIGGAGFSVNDTSGNLTSVTSTRVQSTDGTNTTTLNASGLATSGTVESTDGTNTTTLTAGGLTTDGVLTVTDGTDTTTISANGVTSTTGTLSGSALVAGTGGITSGGALIVSAGGANITGGTTTDTLSVTSDAAIGGNLTVSGNSTVTGTHTVTGLSTLSGGAVISDSLTVRAGTDVDFGGNRIQNVGTPIAATDATNKAYVDSRDAILNDRIKDVRDGVAIALAVQTPDLVAGEKFGVSVNFGTYDGSNAIGVGLQGVLGKNLFGFGERVALTGGVGFATERDNVGGRAGVQFTW
ncbi:YadA-like family protein [Rhodomicrobium sp.]|uniref:YadA-like family protein n=1 Tax=Rhodomicrobium sp. TaxID=2720632 RepID=UPI0039E59E19